MSGRHGVQYVAQCVACAVFGQLITNLSLPSGQDGAAEMKNSDEQRETDGTRWERGLGGRGGEGGIGS